jgi:alkanesulfonate monooxygenase SsuD/methylene tetrahydromethanopterin reductase-like flavin-dependent oxidoreductase (luciferase family)
MREATIDEVEAPQIQVEPGIEIIRMYKPEVGKGAEIISGTPEEIAEQIARLLVERGIVK